MRERERDKHARKHARTRSAHTHAPSPPAASKARRRSASALFAAMRSRCASVSMAPVREATGRRTDAMLLKGLLRIAPGMKLGEYCECGTACVYDGGCVRRARADGRHWTRGTCIPPSLALRQAPSRCRMGGKGGRGAGAFALREGGGYAGACARGHVRMWACAHVDMCVFVAGYECPDEWIYDAPSDYAGFLTKVGVESRKSRLWPSPLPGDTQQENVRARESKSCVRK